MKTDFKKYIGLTLDIKVLWSAYRIKGELVAVYSNVLAVQGITFWGLLVDDITDFKVIQPLFSEVKSLELFQEKGGSTVTPPECIMGHASKSKIKELVGD